MELFVNWLLMDYRMDARIADLYQLLILMLTTFQFAEGEEKDIKC